MAKLTFHVGNLFPYESLWSLFNKLMYWNACDYADFSSLFKARPDLPLSRHRSIFLSKSFFDLERIAALTKIAPGDLSAGLLETYLSPSEIDLFASTRLRFCPACLCEGYHSIFHQLYVLAQCPRHSLPLENHCPQCHRPIETTLGSFHWRYPFKCKVCDHIFYQVSYDPKGDQKGSEFHLLSKVLTNRKGKNTTFLNFLMLGRNIKINPVMGERIRSAWEGLYDGENAHLTSLEYRTFSRAGEGEEICYTREYQKFINFWITPIVERHRPCIDYLGRAGWWMHRGRSLSGFRLCPVAQAYLQWRMLWEYRSEAHGLAFRPVLRSTGTLIDWVSPFEGNPYLSKYIFWAECKMSFLSILNRNITEWKNELINFTSYFMEEDMPYWEAYFDTKINQWFVWHWKVDDNMNYSLPFGFEHEGYVRDTAQLINKSLL